MIIDSIVLRTDQLEELRDFYLRILELRETERHRNSFTVQIGHTSLIFKHITSDTAPSPVYHVAVSIPENLFEEGKHWAKARVQLNQESGTDEVYFSSWDAHSCYFEDPAGNVLELISRHQLNNTGEPPFSSDDLLAVSEIATGAHDVPAIVQQLNETGFPTLGTAYNAFAAVGDPHGLIIIKKRGDRWYFSNQPVDIHPLDLTVNGGLTLAFRNEEGILSIRTSEPGMQEG